MKTICLYFEIHQIIHLKRYRCFDIGTDHYYYDDYENERSITEIAERSYIPALTTLLEMVKNNGGAFKVAFSISGVALEQLEIYSPAVIDLLHQLNDTRLLTALLSFVALSFWISLTYQSTWHWWILSYFRHRIPAAPDGH